MYKQIPNLTELDKKLFNKLYTASNSCWLWVGTKNTDGYGHFYVRSAKRLFLAHRVSYAIKYGSTPTTLQLDHLCRTRDCVNPNHLEPVTNQENSKRGNTGKITGARLKAKTHCKKGHKFTPENTYLKKHKECLSGYTRQCRTCIKNKYK